MIDGRLSKSDERSFEALLNGCAPVEAYIKGHPLSVRWKTETVARKAVALFTPERIEEYKNRTGAGAFPAVEADDLPVVEEDTPGPVESTEKTDSAAPAADNPKPKKIHGLSKYKHEYPEMMVDHFDVPAGEVKEVEVKGKMIKRWVANDLPTLAGFARKIRVHRDTMHEWSQSKDSKTGELRYPEWAYAYRLIKEFQEDILVTNGLKGGYIPSVCIFTMKAVLGWRESQGLEISGPDGGPVESINGEMSPERAAEIYQQSMKQT